MRIISEKARSEWVMLALNITLYAQCVNIIVKRMKKFAFVRKTLLCTKIKVNFTLLKLLLKRQLQLTV